MKKVSFQGTSLTASQRQRLELQRRMRSSGVSPLQQQVDATVQALEVRKEKGVPAEKVWFLVREERGTPCVAELFGY
ncbi:hypothetical protein [Azotobacter beijerinckii]|uniref:Uncharacterized protein n=1 Tax=Azotobacter beijerinckii TaxID=170623 RepID=A0A1I1CTF0_9GAMM|nr:hypothetical protein [Azotobacter beijerinckii]SFB64158.1 hypothetical protein SAMN04244571_04643 [Azotobacter beijerinckii]